MSIDYANMPGVTIVPLKQNAFHSKVKHFRCNVNCRLGDVIWVARSLLAGRLPPNCPVERVKSDSSLE